jgi:hypothetical protein
MGRPTKLTPELQAEIIGYIRACSYIETAVLAAGVRKATFYNWLKWGEEGKQPYADFLDAAKEAQAKARVFASGKVLAGGRGWQGPATWLERTDPERWRRREHVEVAGDPAAPLGVVVYLPKEDPD